MGDFETLRQAMLEEHQPEDCIEDTSLAEQMCRSTGTKTTERERMEMSDGAEHSSGKSWRRHLWLKVTSCNMTN